MSSTSHEVATRYRNWLLRVLPPHEQELLAPHLEPVPLELGRVVAEFNVPIEHVYFPEDGIISSLSVMADGSGVETATIGLEGMSGIAVFHGVEATPEHVFVQVPGKGHRIASHTFRAILPDAPRLTAVLHRYSVALLTLIGQTSGCNRKHSVLRRCARWLLMTHDRVGRDGFELTHHILSQVLGVRRASVTEAALALNEAGAIEYRRGRVTVLDRQALEREACECYGVISSSFDRLLGEGRTPNPLEGVAFSKDGRTIAKDGTPMADPGEGPDSLS
jgi:CRP-like cAMP-binding protein